MEAGLLPGAVAAAIPLGRAVAGPVAGPGWLLRGLSEVRLRLRCQLPMPGRNLMWIPTRTS